MAIIINQDGNKNITLYNDVLNLTKHIPSNWYIYPHPTDYSFVVFTKTPLNNFHDIHLLDNSDYIILNFPSLEENSVENLGLDTNDIDSFISSYRQITSQGIDYVNVVNPLIISSINSDNYVGVKGIGTTTFVPDSSNFSTRVQENFNIDSAGNLQTRGSVTTDEGSFRYDFEGSSVTTNLTGFVFFAGSSVNVVGSGTLFLTELKNKVYIKLTTSSNTYWRQVVEIISNTELVLDRPYPANESGTTHFCQVSYDTNNGTTLTQSSSLATLTVSTNTGTSTIIRSVDYAPIVANSRISVSQRIANQNITIGLSEPYTSTPRWYAVFRLNGTTSNTIICETAGVKTGTPSVNDIETTNVVLPDGLTTSLYLDYRIEVKMQLVRFFINDKLVASHKIHIPSQYDNLGLGLVVFNNGTVGSSTVINIDYIQSNNLNELGVYVPSLGESIVADIPITQLVYGSSSSLNGDLFVIDARQFTSLFLQISSFGVGTITIQGSNDNTFASFVSLQTMSVGTGDLVNSITSIGQYVLPVLTPFIRIRTTSYTSGTFSGNYVGNKQTSPMFFSEDSVPSVQTSPTVSANNTDLFVIDARQYSSIFFRLTTAGSGTISFQGSDDTTFTTVFSIQAMPVSGGVLVSSSNTTGFWQIPVTTPYIRIRTTAYTSGSFIGTYVGSKMPLSITTNIPTVRVTSSAGTSLGVDYGTSGLSSTLVSARTADITSAALNTTTTTSSQNIQPSSISLIIAVTAISGTSPTMDVVLQESIDNINFTDVYHFERITTNGFYESPKLRLKGTYIRYVQTIGGTSASFTRSLTRTSYSDAGSLIKSRYDRSLAINTLSSTTTSTNIEGCKTVGVILNLAAGGTPPILTLQTSSDNTNWITTSNTITGIVNSLVQATFTNILTKYARLIVSTAGTGSTLNYVYFTAIDL